MGMVASSTGSARVLEQSFFFFFPFTMTLTFEDERSCTRDLDECGLSSKLMTLDTDVQKRKFGENGMNIKESLRTLDRAEGENG